MHRTHDRGSCVLHILLLLGLLLLLLLGLLLQLQLHLRQHRSRNTHRAPCCCGWGLQHSSCDSLSRDTEDC